MKTDKLYFGAAYYSEYLPYDRVEQDMEMMERAGMNVIRIAESTWSTLEPADGVFDFTHVDRMLDAAGRHNISVIVGTPTYAIPTWLAKKYPDILAVTHGVTEIYGRRQNMDITHPGYLSHAERVIRALMEHVKDAPHVIGYQLDNETKSYDTAGPRVQKMFVDYLKEQFPDINEFNREFGLDYWSNRVNYWDDFPDVRGTINGSLAAEFRRFQRKLVTDFLSWQAAIVREYARDDQFITQNFDFDWVGHSYGLQPEVDQVAAAKCMTVAGADIYHPSQGRLTGEEITVCGNIARGIKNENYLILETEAQGNIDWLPYPGQLRLQAYSHIANGSNSVMYWHWHSIHNAIESYWKGVLSHDFSENGTYREAAVIGAEFKRIGDRIKNLQKKNAVGVLTDNASLTGLIQFPLEGFASDNTHCYNDVLRFVCDSLYRLNVEYDMVSSDTRDFSAYKCMVVPALYSAPEGLLAALDRYVADGGHMVATFRTGFADEHIKIYADTQPHILHKCLGIHYDQFTHPVDVGVQIDTNWIQQALYSDCTNNMPENLADADSRNTRNLQGLQKSHPCDSHGNNVPYGKADNNQMNNMGEINAENTAVGTASTWMDLVTCDTATTVARYVHPAWGRYAAVTENNYGSGSALYIATRFEDALLDEILCAYLDKHGITDASEPLPRFPVIIKKGINDYGREACFYLNFSDTPQRAIYLGQDGVELLTKKKFVHGENIVLEPWGVSIIEHDV